MWWRRTASAVRRPPPRFYARRLLGLRDAGTEVPALLRSAARTGAGRLAHEFLEAAARRALVASTGDTAEHVARFVRRQPFGPRAFDVVADRSVLRAADPDAVLPARIADRVAAALRRVLGAADPLVRLGIRDDQGVVLEYPDAARPAEV